MPSTMLHRAWSWLRLALPVVVGLAPSAQATALSQQANTVMDEPAAPAVTVKQIGGALFFSERGGPFTPVPDGPQAAALRQLLGSDAAPVSVEVGRTIVADGGSGWHNNKP